MTTASETQACICGGSLEIIDAAGHSYTGFCASCQRASLVIDDPRYKLNVWLADFHLKRGEDSGQRPRADRGMAKRLVQCLDNNHWPSPATCLDFGIDGTRHFRALQCAVKLGMTAYDLDRVIGDGPAITRLVRGIPNQPDADIEFRTAYDGMLNPWDNDEY